MKNKSKIFRTEVIMYQSDRFSKPALKINLPERIAKNYCWGDKVRVTIEEA